MEHVHIPSLDYMLGIARERATIEGREYAVVLMDKGDSRVRRVVRLDYLDEPEFIEFGGRIECVVQP